MSHLERALKKAHVAGAADAQRDLENVVFVPAWDFGSASDTLPATPTVGSRGARRQPTPARQAVPARKTGIVDEAIGCKLVVGDLARDDVCTQFRKIAASLVDLPQINGARVVLVASAVPGEGKTLTAVNLALTLADAYGARGLLVDADLRRPSVHSLFQLSNRRGFRDAADDQPLAVIKVLDRLDVLPAGEIPKTKESSSELIAALLRRTIAHARSDYDWIVLDTPPVDLMPDTKIIATLVDAVVLVVQAASTPCARVLRAIDAIGRERITGVVLNQVREPVPVYGYYDYGRQAE
jgi:protein-tyrosine kinase